MASRTPRIRKLTPPALLAEAVRELKSLGSPARAAGAKAYFKKSGPVYFFGASVPQVRALAHRLYNDVREIWTVRDAVAFAGLALRKRENETRSLGIFVLSRFARDYSADLAATIEGWIDAGRCDNWALVDTLSAEVITPLIRRYPVLLPTVTGWHKSPNPWLRRASLVPLVPFARNGEHLAAAYSLVAALMSDAEDLTHKASGWLLREAGTTNPRRLSAFLVRHGSAIPRTTVRYAIEHFPAEDRARLLELTRLPQPV